VENHCEDPAAEYRRRLEQRRASVATLARRDLAISNLRLVVAIAAVSMGWLAWGRGLFSGWWLVAPSALFLAIAVLHDRVIRARRRYDRAARFYEHCLERLDHRWSGRGEPGTRFLDEAHPFSADLDLFGSGSLFELICTARTRAGEETLAAWLHAPASPGVVRDRQAAVTELRPMLDLREDLALLGEEVRTGVDPDALASWASGPPTLAASVAGLRAIGLVAAALALASVGSLTAWWLGVWGPAPAAAALLLQTVFGVRLRPRVNRSLAAVDRACRDLSLFSSLLARLERERFASPLLASLRAGLESEGTPPSSRIARLRLLVDLLDARRHQLFTPLSYLLFWSTQFACAIEAWRAVSGPGIPRWLAAVGEMEALCGLAGYAFEHPADPFPELVEERSVFDAAGIGHPLIPSSRCVRNDVTLDGDKRVLLVSGSNMSGKSTLLRAVGTNTVLAMAGAPVRARRLRLSPLAVGASIRINDSLQAGTSRFYAEITRLRRIMDLASGPTPVLFLIDEMLHGTNSHDRRIGAEAVVRGLVDRGALGLVTTHDLALSEICEALAPHAANVHFEDHLEDGRMVFDYVMRPGIVRKSNALELMRAVGLEV